MQKIIFGDCLDVMKTFPDNHFSAVVTDPPYGLHFMGKDWDKYAKGKVKVGRKVLGTHSNSEAHEAARYDESRNDEFQSFMQQMAFEALRITKPGGHILMFGAPRRYHRQVCALEDAGWEIRDCLMWIFSSGFPKSHNHFGIEGYGTALKPAYEPIIMAMKPLEGTFKQNAEKWGQAGINIDRSRIETQEDLTRECLGHASASHEGYKRPYHEIAEKKIYGSTKGRWPANVIFDEEAGGMLDEQSGLSKSNIRPSTPGIKKSQGRYGDYIDVGYERGTNDSGGASRFFYCAKTSSRERNEGLNEQKNVHPTIKPLKLMEYLIRLVMPPKDGILLDPFAGSGSTILAAKRLGFSAIGIEKQPEYVEIAQTRIDSFKPCFPELDLFSHDLQNIS